MRLTLTGFAVVWLTALSLFAFVHLHRHPPLANGVRGASELSTHR